MAKAAVVYFFHFFYLACLAIDWSNQAGIFQQFYISFNTATRPKRLNAPANGKRATGDECVTP